jgi:hypothetical protein
MYERICSFKSVQEASRALRDKKTGSIVKTANRRSDESIHGEMRTEYALIPAAFAVVVYGVYAPTSNNVGSFGGGTDAAPVQMRVEQQSRVSGLGTLEEEGE